MLSRVLLRCRTKALPCSTLPLRAGKRSASSGVASAPLVELREDTLHCERAAEYAALASKIRSEQSDTLPLRLLCMPDAGGTLNVATQLCYFASGHLERDATYKAIRAAAAANKDVIESQKCVRKQSSLLFVEAPLVSQHGLHGASGAGCPGGEASETAIYELRRYQLKLGYDTVPRFLEMYGSGLPSKLSAVGTDASTSLVTLLYTEVGSLNEVIELWRHGGGTMAMEQSRRAARGATEWRKAIAEIAGLAVSFTTTIHKPLSCSPWC